MEVTELQINRIITGDSLATLQTLPAESVSMVITSPPYWGLRDYGIEGQLGLEDHPQKYINRMVEIFREVKRVLRKDGSLYLNMGDTYGNCSNDGGIGEARTTGKNDATMLSQRRCTYNGERSNWLRPKQKLMIPSRLAIALQDDGWLLRNDIIWYKRNHIPSSVKDRLANAYEHIFFFAKNERYYYDLDAIREQAQNSTIERFKYPLRALTQIDDGRGLTNKSSLAENIKLDPHPVGVNPGDVFQSNKAPYLKNNPHTMRLNAEGHIALDPSRPADLSHPNGKNPGDFWDITTRAYPEAHFATFPPMLCVRPILASCPAEICSKCGKPRQRMTETTYVDNPKGGYIWTNRIDNNERTNKIPSRLATSNTVGWSSCSCNAGYEPGIVLDIFAGSGTACAVAKALGRKYLGIEINPKYVALAEKRIGKVIAPLSPVTKVKDAEKALNEWQEVMG